MNSFATHRLSFDRTVPYFIVGGKIFARSLPLLRSKLAPYLKVPGVSVRTARTGAMQDIKNHSLPGIAPITSCGSGEDMNGVLNTVHSTLSLSSSLFVNSIYLLYLTNCEISLV